MTQPDPTAEKVSRRCLRLLPDGSQCPEVVWCPMHGSVDTYAPPAQVVGFTKGQTVRIVRVGEPDRFYRVIESDKDGSDVSLTLELDVFRSNEAAFKHEAERGWQP